MIDWINDFFGIDNSVSVPTLISLIVFVTGGTVNYLFKEFKTYSLRKSKRTTFRNLLTEISKDLKNKERNLNNFFPQIDIKREEAHLFKHKDITYLETIFEFNFNEIYTSFQKKFFFSFNRKLKSKAFHRIWSLLKKHKFYEVRLFEYLDNFHKSFNKELEEYSFKMEKYRELRAENYHKFEIDSIIDEDEKDETEFYLGVQEEIWKAWFDLGEIRTHHYYSYNELVLPLLKLNREYSHLPITLEFANILILCELQFKQMEQIIDSYKGIFKDYYLGYRRDSKLLNYYIGLI